MNITEKQVKDLEQVWFENFLKDTHYDLFPMLKDDDLSDHYNEWIGGLSGKEIRDYAESWWKTMGGWVADEFISRNFAPLKNSMEKIKPMDLDSIIREYTYRLSEDEEAPLCTPDFIRMSHKQYAKYFLEALDEWAGQRIIPNLLVEKDDWNGGYNRAIRDIKNEIADKL